MGKKTLLKFIKDISSRYSLRLIQYVHDIFNLLSEVFMRFFISSLILLNLFFIQSANASLVFNCGDPSKFDRYNIEALPVDGTDGSYKVTVQAYLGVTSDVLSEYTATIQQDHLVGKESLKRWTFIGPMHEDLVITAKAKESETNIFTGLAQFSRPKSEEPKLNRLDIKNVGCTITEDGNSPKKPEFATDIQCEAERQQNVNSESFTSRLILVPNSSVKYVSETTIDSFKFTAIEKTLDNTLSLRISATAPESSIPYFADSFTTIENPNANSRWSFSYIDTNASGDSKPTYAINCKWSPAK